MGFAAFGFGVLLGGPGGGAVVGSGGSGQGDLHFMHL